MDHFIELEVMERQITENPATAGKQTAVRDIFAAQHAYFVELIGDNALKFPSDFKTGALHRQNAILDFLELTGIKHIPDKVLNMRLNQ